MAALVRVLTAGVVLAVLSAACGSSGDTAPTTTAEAPPSTVASAAPSTTVAPITTVAPTTTMPESTTTVAPATALSATTAVDPPTWLGTRVLEIDVDGNVPPVPTPPELVDRRFRTSDLLPPPAHGFAATIHPVPGDVVARSTWHDGCPIAVDELAYVTVSFWGFDDLPHTGELVVNARLAGDIVDVFEQLYQARFPIEEMRVVAAWELDAPPTGDGNNTTSFVCRPTTGGTTWSQHAYGLAIDLNPFHNPYLRAGTVLPELAGAYLDREDIRPGMILEGDPAVEAFAAIGWRWGGAFRSLLDFMHFSANGR